MYPCLLALALGIFAGLFAPDLAHAQRGGEITVTISPPPEIKAELPFYAASGEHKLHFANTTSRDARIVSMELLFIEQSERSRSCDLFFGNTIGAAVRRYDLKDIAVPSAKSAAAATKMLPPGPEEPDRIEPVSREQREPRVTIIACYRFIYELDGAELEVNAFAGRWTFDRRTGKLVARNTAPKAELLPR